jgi:hypothetical protein
LHEPELVARLSSWRLAPINKKGVPSAEGPLLRFTAPPKYVLTLQVRAVVCLASEGGGTRTHDLGIKSLLLQATRCSILFVFQ